MRAAGAPSTMRRRLEFLYASSKGCSGKAVGSITWCVSSSEGSAISPLYLPYISATSPLYLAYHLVREQLGVVGYISPTSPLYLPYISPTSPRPAFQPPSAKGARRGSPPCAACDAAPAGGGPPTLARAATPQAEVEAGALVDGVRRVLRALTPTLSLSLTLTLSRTRTLTLTLTLSLGAGRTEPGRKVTCPCSMSTTLSMCSKYVPLVRVRVRVRDKG